MVRKNELEKEHENDGRRGNDDTLCIVERKTTGGSLEEKYNVRKKGHF